MEIAVEQRDLNTDEQTWYAIYTIVRHEKSANAALSDKQIDTFLPIKKVVSRWKDRKKDINTPLFPGYLFVNSSLENRLKILNTEVSYEYLASVGIRFPCLMNRLSRLKGSLRQTCNLIPIHILRKGKKL